MTDTAMASPAQAGDAPQTTRPPLLSMSGIDKIFNGDVVALKDMNLDVREGDFISLLGPSGCGKSTALRLIADLLHPTSGRIRWDVPKDPGALSVVLQEPTLMPWATVEDNVYLPFRIQGVAKAKVKDDIREVLALVGLENFLNSYPRELSGGMKMRVSIARADRKSVV